MSEHHRRENIGRACEDVALVRAQAESRLMLSGRDGLDLLHRLSTNDLLHWSQTSMTATVLTNEKGRIIDAVRVVRYGAGHLLLGSADAEQEVLRWITKYTIADDVAVRSITGDSKLWILVGPQSPATAERLRVNSGDNVAFFPDATTRLPRVYILEMGNTGASIESRAAEDDVPLLVPEEWETVRVLYGIPAYGHELDAKFNPFDVGLDALISRTKGCYVGQEVIARIETYHKNRKTLIGFTAPGTTLLTVGHALRREGLDAGHITSIAPIAVGGRVAGLAVAPGDSSVAGTIFVSESGGEITVSMIPIPYTQRNSIHE